MKLFNLNYSVSMSAIALGAAFTASPALADIYEIQLTNVTANQAFTPRLAVTHTLGQIFTLGDPALDELALIAESGDIAPLMALLETGGEIVTDIQVGDGLLMPGDTQTITIDGTPGTLFSMFNMLIPTNDAFLGLNGVMLPNSGSVTYRATVYDAGSETNDEICSNIPGPVCGGVGSSPDDAGEGFIHVHRGIKGGGDLSAATYDWNNPAAVVTVTKI